MLVNTLDTNHASTACEIKEELGQERTGIGVPRKTGASMHQMRDLELIKHIYAVFQHSY